MIIEEVFCIDITTSHLSCIYIPLQYLGSAKVEWSFCTKIDLPE